MELQLRRPIQLSDCRIKPSDVETELFPRHAVSSTETTGRKMVRPGLSSWFLSTQAKVKNHPQNLVFTQVLDSFRIYQVRVKRVKVNEPLRR